MSISPSSTINLYKNVPLDNTYKHTLYFNNRSAQSNYFAGLTGTLTLTPNTYQRVNKGVFRAGHSANTMYSYNYMSFINNDEHYERKTFYAFITQVEYVNDSVCDVYYEIDAMQTWLANVDYELGKQYVEREHIENDVFGANIVPEPFDVGEYVYGAAETIYDMTENGVEYFVGYTNGWNTPDANISAKVYNGIASIPIAVCHNSDGLNAMLDNVTGMVHTIDDIKFIYIVPKGFFTYQAYTTNIGILGTGATTKSKTCAQVSTTASFKDTSDGESYRPVNKKLYTYPYNFYTVYNNNGDSLTLRYEFFSGHTPKFNLKCSCMPPVQVVCLPSGYKNYGSYNYTEFISFDDFPTCSWVADTYQSWLAQGGVAQAINGVKNTALSSANGAISGAMRSGSRGGAKGAVVGGVVGGVISGLANAIDFQSAHYQASIATDNVKGSATGSVLLTNLDMQFQGVRTHITRNMCKCIDDFFTRYGYATNEIKEPNISSRPRWNYVKTNGCTITGSLPAPMLNLINNIFDGGITFWKPTATVGDYDADNT